MDIKEIQIGGRTINVDISLADRLEAANRAKMRSTGTPIKITESFRTRERQQELYDKSQAGLIGRAAPPGHSFHETGKAVDVHNPAESQDFLRRFGLRNDLAGDSGHFSIGETKEERFTKLAENVEKGRQQGITDTKLLDILSSKQKDFIEPIKKARANFGVDPDIKNDRDLINFLALRFSGVGNLQTPSVPDKVERGGLGEAKPKKKGFFRRSQETFERRASGIVKTIKESVAGDITPAEAGIRTVGDVIGAGADVAGDIIVSGLKLIPGTEELGGAVLNTPTAQSLLAEIGKGIEAYDKKKKENKAFERTAEVLESVVDISEIFGGGLVAKKGLKVAKEVAEEVVEKGVKVVKKVEPIVESGIEIVQKAPKKAIGVVREKIAARKETIETILSPSITKKRKAELIKKGLVKEGEGFPGLGKAPDVIVPDKDVKAITNTFKNKIPDIDKLNRFEIVTKANEAIKETAKILRPELKKINFTPKNRGQLIEEWSTIKAKQLKEPLFLAKTSSNKSFQKQFDDFLQFTKRKLKDQDTGKFRDWTMEDIWDMRIEYDRIVPDTVKNATDASSDAVQFQNRMWRENRKALNQFMFDELEATNIKDRFRDMSNLYEGINNISSKGEIDLKGTPNIIKKFSPIKILR